jgi:hypothetical protein
VGSGLHLERLAAKERVVLAFPWRSTRVSHGQLTIVPSTLREIDDHLDQGK